MEVIIHTSVGVSNFWLAILQRQRHTKIRVKHLRWSFSGKIEDDFLVVKNSMLLPHYPRKIKYLENVIKITLKKKSLSAIEGKSYIDNYLWLHLPCRKTPRPKHSNYWEVMLGFFIRQFFKLLIDIGVSVSNFGLVILQRWRRTKTRVTHLWWNFFGQIKDGFWLLKILRS